VFLIKKIMSSFYSIVVSSKKNVECHVSTVFYHMISYRTVCHIYIGVLYVSVFGSEGSLYVSVYHTVQYVPMDHHKKRTREERM
jgi:hypothetical protein